jgi:hypothetical protein
LTFHRQPRDRKQDVADDIRDWVRVLLSDPKAELATLERLSLPNLVSLSVAIDKAGEAWMSGLVHDVMSSKRDT